MGEDIRTCRDVFLHTFRIAGLAPSKRAGIGVTSPLLRNITTIARAAAALNEVNSSQFRLGLGVGGLQDLARLGITVTRPVQAMESAVEVLRNIWSGQILTLKTETTELEQYQARYCSSTSIPIYLGVRGQHLLRLAGKVADGIILSGPVTYLEKAIRIVRNHPARQLPTSPRIVVWLPTVLTITKKDLRLAKSATATVIADTPKSVLEMDEVSQEALWLQETVRRRGYAIASTAVTDNLLNHFAIAGNAERICGVFESLGRLGADEVVFGPPYGRRPLASVREVAEMWERF